MQNTKHQFLQIGLGSMGKRRIRNLLFHKIHPAQIAGFDPSAERRLEVEKKIGIKSYATLNQAIHAKRPDVFIISTPPNLHHQYFLKAAKEKKHFFVEISTTDAGYNKLYPLLDGTFVAAPSCTFRYFPAIKKIKELIQKKNIGKILTFQHYAGQYLPDWHPWEDYRKVYFAQKETGACKEIFGYELIWLTDILNSIPTQIGGFVGKISNLDMTADDLYSAILQMKNGIVGTLTIDALARAPFRTLRLIGSKGVIQWEWQNHEIKIYRANTKKWKKIPIKKGKNEKYYVTTEEMYQEEMNYFLNAINGKTKYPYTFQKDHLILKTVQALERGSKNGKFIKL